jgi:hypothetical protein
MLTPKKNTVTSLEVLEARIAPATIFVVNDNNQLISFDSATPGTIIATKTITGLSNANGGVETVKGIDFRPADGKLYALGIDVIAGANNDQGRIYTVDLSGANAVLTQVGVTPFFSAFADNDDFGFDINPSSDLVRVVTDRDDNIRVNPNTGGLVLADTDLSPNTAQVVGAAYDRNFEGTPQTTLYGIDINTSSLVRIGGNNGNPSPNGGVLTSIGALNLDLTNQFKVGFDIESRTGIAYAVMRPVGGVTTLYTINLSIGLATAVGAVGGNPLLNGLSVALPNDLTIVNNTTATYIDQDGDKVTVKLTGAAAGAALGADDFTFSAGQFGSKLKLLNLSDDGQEWAHANITINAVPLAGLGDSFATIGYINAVGVDLGKVSVNGDLGRIDAGDVATTTPGLVSLTAHSMGVFSNSQLPTATGIPNQTSNIVGKLGSLTVKTDLSRELISVSGGVSDGAIGTVSVGGDIIGVGFLVSGGISTNGSIGNVTIGGSILGGSASGVGSVKSGTSMGNVTVGGSVIGGGGSNSGIIESGTTMGNVVVKGSLIGGTTDHSGDVHAFGSMGNVVIKGSIIGGAVANPGSDLDSGLLYSFGASIGSIKIGGNLEGVAGDFSGAIFASGTIKAVTIGGYIQGGAGTQSGAINASGNMGPVTIARDATGGGGNYSGSVYTFGNGNIASVTIGGSLVGTNTLTGILSENQLGPVNIRGEVRGASPGGVRISAEGGIDAATAKLARAITSVTVTGSVKNALILGGYNETGAAMNPDATIGAVKVSGDWIATSLIAGTKAGLDTLFGTSDDVKIAEAAPDALFSKIASVTIKGEAVGTVGGTDHYGIVAEQVGKVKVGLRSYTLAAGTDTVGFDLGTTLDFRVREV